MKTKTYDLLKHVFGSRLSDKKRGINVFYNWKHEKETEAEIQAVKDLLNVTGNYDQDQKAVEVIEKQILLLESLKSEDLDWMQAMEKLKEIKEE